MLFQRQVSSARLDGMVAGENLLSAFDGDAIGPEALLFKTSCLTIASEERVAGEAPCELCDPDREVQRCVDRTLLSRLVAESPRQSGNSLRLQRPPEANDFTGVRALFESFYASIPCECYSNNSITNQEGLHASVFYSCVAALGLDITVEDSGSHGRLNMAVRFGGQVFEFKLEGSGGRGSAMGYLPSRDHADESRLPGCLIHRTVVVCNPESRSNSALEWAPVP